jgi:hypothetical protein
VNPFQSLPEYEDFIYTLPQQFQAIVSSKLVVARRGARLATVSGEIMLTGGYRLSVKERLTCEDDHLSLVSYGYEVWHGEEELYWYDSQPHPSDPSLAFTHPHHKHVPPDIKHHRVPAPDMSFVQPNLPALITEIERELLAHLPTNTEKPKATHHRQAEGGPHRLDERTKRGDRAKFEAAMAKAPDVEPEEYDRL